MAKKDPYGGNGRALIVGEPEGLVKVIAEKGPTAGPGASSASTWSGRGSPSSSARATWRSTGKRPSDEVAHFIQPHPTLSENFGETVLALTGRGMHVG